MSSDRFPLVPNSVAKDHLAENYLMARYSADHHLTSHRPDGLTLFLQSGSACGFSSTAGFAIFQNNKTPEPALQETVQ